MENGTPSWERISRKLTGEGDAPGEKPFTEWLREDASRDENFRDASAIWKHTPPKKELVDADVDRAWEEFVQRRGQDRSAKVVTMLSDPWLARIAAAVLVLAIVVFLVIRPGKDRVFTAASEVTVVLLPDSSTVWLNVGARLTLSDDFSGPQRAASLAGEGYFKVRPDAGRPFIVSFADGNVTVRGTAFNVNALDTMTKVSVTEGLVVVSNAAGDSALLKKDQEADLRGGQEIVSRERKDRKYLSWRMKNNPVADREKAAALAHLRQTSSWKKNFLNMSVLEGSLTNSATVVAFHDIALKVRYSKTNGTEGVIRVNIEETVHPGETIQFQRRLLDILTNTQLIAVEIESARAVE